MRFESLKNIKKCAQHGKFIDKLLGSSTKTSTSPRITEIDLSKYEEVLEDNLRNLVRSQN